jgi:quinol monooxygenase YgiN
MIHVIAVISANPGQREKILEVLRDNLAAVRAEKGCIEYSPVVDAEFGSFQTPLGPDTLMVIEKWQDAAALKAHAVAPHMVAYAAKVKGLITTRTVHVVSSAA